MSQFSKLRERNQGMSHTRSTAGLMPTASATLPLSTNRLSRRKWLSRCGISSLAGLLAGRPLHAASTTKSSLGSSHSPLRSCIFIFCYGGPSQLEMFDPKPNAPAEVRGEFGTIATAVPGIHMGEHLPELANRMDRMALVRSMHHSNRLHDSASIETFTGRQGPDGDREEFGPLPQFFPCHGGVVHSFQPDEGLRMKHAVLPWLFHNFVDVPAQGGGFLGSAFDPLVISGDPANSQFDAKMLTIPAQLDSRRIAERRRLLQEMESTTHLNRPAAQLLKEYYEQAYSLLESSALKKALKIDEEPQSLRERYGLYENKTEPGGKAAALAYGRNLRGQSFLQARRLVEAGMSFVNVNDFRQQGQNWDAHSDNFGQHRNYLIPPIDKGVSALLDDLSERGLLDSTLVVLLGEFGRTPKINGNAGRDHWPDCYSIALAGGGIRGGAVLGESDAQAAYPARDPVTPADLAATIYWRFGIDPHSEIHDTTGRPWRLSEGRPLVELFG